MIVGQPFLHDLRGVPHFTDLFMETRLGPLLLFYDTKFGLSLAVMQLSDLSADDRARLIERTQDLQLSPDYQEALLAALLEFCTVWTNERRGCAARTLEHHIILDTTRPIVDRPRRHPPELLRVAEKEIQDMLSQGVIRPSSSPYAAEIVLVQKKAEKGGGVRFCIDYRKLNQHTIADRHP
jgi:hypothetical protein